MRKNWQAFLCFILPICFFLYGFSQNRFIISYDTTHLFYVLKRWYWTNITSGQFPLWNEFTFGGVYQLSSPALAVLSPIAALFYSIFDSVLAEEFQLAFFAGVAGLGMFAVSRQLGQSKGTSFVIGLAYAFNGAFLSLSDRSPIFISCALYPWVLFQYFKNRSATNLVSFFPMSLIISMMIIHGDWIAVALISTFFIMDSIYIAFSVDESQKKAAQKSVLMLLFSLSLSACLTAITTIPAFENIPETTRASGFTFEEVSYYSLHPLRLLNFVLPEFFGQYSRGDFWGKSIANAYQADRFWYHSIYLSIPILILGFAGLIRALKNKSLLILFAGSLVCLLISFGLYFNLHQFLFEHISFYRSLRFPEKFIYYFIFTWILLAIYGLELLSIKKQFFTRFCLACAALHGLALIIIIYWLPNSELFLTYFKEPNTNSQLVTSFLVESTWAHGVFLGAYLLISKFNLKLSQETKLGFLIVCELCFFQPVVITTQLETLEAKPSFLKELKEKDTGRVVRDGVIDQVTPLEPVRTSVPNWPILYGIEQVFGYDTNHPKKIQSLSGAEVFIHLDIWSRLLNITHVITSLQKVEELKVWAANGFIKPVAIDKNLKLVLLKIMRTPAKYEIFSKFVLVNSPQDAFLEIFKRGSQKGNVILENPPLNLVLTNITPTVNVQNILHTSDKRTYKISTDQPIIFVERENFHPGWQAYVNNTQTTVLKADYLNRAVFLPKGEHLLEFKFKPRGFYVGALLSAFALFIMTFLWILAKGCKFRRKIDILPS